MKRSFQLTPLQAHCNGSNPSNAGFLTMAYSTTYTSTCWEWADVVLSRVVTALEEGMVTITRALGVAVT